MAYTDDDELDEVDAMYKERWGMTPHEEFLHNQKRFEFPIDNDEVLEVYDEPLDGDDELSDDGYFVMKQFFGF